MNEIGTNVKGCARCGQDHNGLSFSEFTNPIQDKDGTTWTHWALCPTSSEPILMRIETDSAAAIFVNKPDWLAVPTGK